MGYGDLVQAKNAPSKIGIITEVRFGLFMTLFRVLWSDGTDVLLESGRVELVNERYRNDLS